MNKMYRSFFIKLIVFILIIVAVDFLVGKGLDCFNHFSLEKNPYHVAMKTPYMVEKASEEILIVGASEASHHYIPQMISDSTSMTVYNCGQDGSFFLYQNCLINLTLKRYSPKIIIWQFGADCLTDFCNKVLEYQNISSLYPYYSDAYCRKVIEENSKFQRFQMLSSTYRHNSKLLSYFMPLVNFQDFDHGYVPIKETGYQFPEISDSIGNYPIDSAKIQRLIETVNYCKEKNVLLILSVAPSYYDEAIYSTPQYIKLLSVAKENKVPVIESRKYYQAFQDSTLFKDVNHMNDKGTKLWMRYFIPELKQVLNEYKVE